jgi:F-type H+-transporting ATPase subunit epsilon
MLPDHLDLEIATPERRVLKETVDEVVFPSVEGYMGVLPGHAPLLAMLDVGEVSYRIGSERRYLACAGGFAEVQPGRVSILADTVERAEEIDLARAESAQERARETLARVGSEHEFRRAEVSLKKAISRIQVSGRAGR